MNNIFTLFYNDSDNEFSNDVDHGKSNQVFLHQQNHSTFHISGFCVYRKLTSKYILENPQSKLCNREMEINHNDNHEKCAINDDTTSDNSMIPIILPKSPKEGRKIVFINENERPHNKYRIESESEEEVIEQKNKDILKLKSTTKTKAEKNKRQKN